jgi:hypothetical protein
LKDIWSSAVIVFYGQLPANGQRSCALVAAMGQSALTANEPCAHTHAAQKHLDSSDTIGYLFIRTLTPGRCTMRHATAIGLLFLLPALQAVGSPPLGNKSPERTDLQGEPLPPGALARLGSARLHYTSFSDGFDFSPDGKTLVSGSADHTLLLWSFRPIPAREVARPLEQTWDDLGKSGPVVHAAFNEMIARPAVTLPWLRARLQPAKAVSGARVNELIEQLASPRYVERERATQALEQLEDLVQPALRATLSTSPPERHRRLELLLRKLEGPVPEPSQCRVLRAIAVLEWIGKPAAREVLAALAQGAAGARRTEDARAALERLNRREN